MTFDLTAGELVRLGRCDGKCLLALETRCDCKCRGTFHGLLADIPLASVAPMSANVSRSIEGAWTSAGTRPVSTPSRSVRQSRGPIDELTVNRIIDLFAQGVPVRSIAQGMRVSESAVRKRLKEFEANGTVRVGDS